MGQILSTSRGSRVRVQVPEYGFWEKKAKITNIFKMSKNTFQSLIFIYKAVAGQFAMSHGSYDLDLGSEILILGRDIRSRTCPNIGGTYSISVLVPVYQNVTFGFRYYLNDLTYNIRQVLISRLLCVWCQP